MSIEGLPKVIRAYGSIDRALVRAASFQLFGKSPTMIFRNRLNNLAFRTIFSKGEDVVATLVGGARLVVRSDDQASASLLFEGKKNDHVSEILLALTELSQCFFDVGANYGYFAIAAGYRHPRLHVVAIEPNPSLVRLIERSVQLNELAEVAVFPAACGETSGNAVLHFSQRSSGTGSFTASRESRCEVNARIIPLDSIFFDYFDSHDDRPAIIKVDVEGFEVQALLGARRALRTSPVVICEVTRSTFPAVRDIAIDSGLQIYGFNGETADEASLFSIGRKKTDILICSEERLPCLSRYLVDDKKDR